MEMRMETCVGRRCWLMMPQTMAENSDTLAPGPSFMTVITSTTMIIFFIEHTPDGRGDSLADMAMYEYNDQQLVAY